MPEIMLYGADISPNVRAARIAFQEKSVPITFSDIGFSGLSEDGFGRINPFRKMPALTHGDVVLHETPALMVYADAIGSGPSLVPEGPADRARMWQFIGTAQHHLYLTGISQFFFHRELAPLFGIVPDRTAAAAANVPTAQSLDALECGLAGGHLAGPALSLADILCGVMVDYIGRTPDGHRLLGERPATSAWLAALRARPSFVATLAPALHGMEQA